MVSGAGIYKPNHLLGAGLRVEGCEFWVKGYTASYHFAVEHHRVVVGEIVQRSVLHPLHDKQRLILAIDHGTHHRRNTRVPQPREQTHLLDEFSPRHLPSIQRD